MQSLRSKQIWLWFWERECMLFVINPRLRIFLLQSNWVGKGGCQESTSAQSEIKTLPHLNLTALT